MFDAKELRKQLMSAGCPEVVANKIVDSVAEMNSVNNDTEIAQQTLNAVKFANDMTEKVLEKNIPEPVAEEFLEVYSRLGKISENIVNLAESMKEGISLVSELVNSVQTHSDKIDKLEQLADEFIESKENGYFG